MNQFTIIDIFIKYTSRGNASTMTREEFGVPKYEYLPDKQVYNY